MLNQIFTLMRAEWMLTLIIFILLFIKVGSNGWKKEPLLNLIMLLLLVNFLAGFFSCPNGSLFGDMYRSSALTNLEKNMLNGGTLIISMLAYPWLQHQEHVEEFFLLLLSTLLGMFFMISSYNLLMFYLGLELSTIPLAALANFDLAKRKSSEAAFKFIISSAFSSGLLLFGISLVYGITGSLGFGDIAQHADSNPLLLFAFILLFAGFGFKISVVPFHLWTADVYEGSPVAITAYLSVISKGAIFFVLVPVLYTVFKPLSETWYRMLLLLSILTMLTGNLFALRQQNMKRLLAFSSIAQVGFILVGISGSSKMGSASVVYFILIYIFSNLGAFGVVAVISALTGKENLGDYKGLYHSNPALAWMLAISLFSLAGIPPVAGFFGKFFLLMAGAGKGNYGLIIIAALNMIVSLYYYLNVVRVILMDKNDEPLAKLNLALWPRLALWVCMAGMIITGLAGSIYDYIYSLSTGF
ncbi:MAG TPA: NADH-quinone oxidoreductase subunit N [Puia sp.]|nr:NADH-quinone oxidoreductase subunit N [Puia sp.]